MRVCRSAVPASVAAAASAWERMASWLASSAASRIPAQLPADVRWCPFGLGLVAVAHVPQRRLRQGADVDGVGAGKGGAPRVPGRALLRRTARRLGADRVGLVPGAVQLAVGADRAGPLLPVQPLPRILRHGPKGTQRPVGLGLHGVLADPFGPLVHRLGEPPDVLLPLGVGDLGHPLAPWAQRQRDQRLDHRPHPRVQHAGHVPGSFEGPGPDRCLGDLGGVQAGQLGGLHGPVQPGGLRAELAAPLLRQRILDYPLVALVVCRPHLVGPAGVQQAEVIGPDQALALVLGRRVLARLPAQAAGRTALHR